MYPCLVVHFNWQCGSIVHKVFPKAYISTERFHCITEHKQ